MQWNKHSALTGQHALLSASKPYWLNYDEDKFDRYLVVSEMAAKGSRLHAIAHQLINEGIRLPDSRKTLNMYVNDAIGYRMRPEQLLFYSVNCFGTADAISFSERMMKLRISDLKTGESPATPKQLLIYSALWFLEYGLSMGYRPSDVTVELRIYQNNDVALYIADPIDIMYIMDKIISLDKRIEARREEAGK